MTSPRSEPSENNSDNTGKLGTFAGVFTPSILTILGIILFLRLGYITGSGGVAQVLIILALANLITLFTSQSLAAIATNVHVKGGGDYYLISRTLGYKFGGSIGLVLFLAQSISVAFYCIGFAEAITFMSGSTINPAFIAAAAVLALFILAWLGADWATKFQYGVMLLLLLALFSFYAGTIEHWQQSVFIDNWAPPENSMPFWLLFALFFPAVTGFTQGVSMSGDLKDPAKSLPLGTFLAVGVSIAVYLSVIVLFAGARSSHELAEDYQAMQKVSRWGFLIDLGVIAATLSSAMASFLGGPRILQSLAADRIFPLLTFFSHTSGEGNNPRRGIVLSAIIALVTISLGQLNLIAQLVSMFFLISYGLLNYATYYEAKTESPSFRPRFKYFNKHVSLVGCLLCLAVLIAVDINNGVIALTILLAIYLYLQHRAKPSRWADSSRSYAFNQIRKNLVTMNKIPEHHNDWYPHLLLFTKSPETRAKLLTFGELICGKIGLMSGVELLTTSQPHYRKIQADALQKLKEDIQETGVFCFPETVRIEDFSSSLPLVLQSLGVGPLQPNTVIANWPGKAHKSLAGMEQLKFGHNLRIAFRLGYNLGLFHCDTAQWERLNSTEGRRERIDIWWEGDTNSSRLMLLFGFLITKNPLWEKAQIRVLTTGKGTSLTQAKERLTHIVNEARIEAIPEIVPDMDPETVINYSLESSLVLLPFRIQHSRITDINGFSLQRCVTQLPPVFLVKAAEEIDLNADPEDGVAGDLAKGMDSFTDLEKRMIQLEGEEQKTLAQIETIREQLASLEENPKENDEEQQNLRDALNKAEQAAEQCFRKKAKLTARMEDTIKEIEELGGQMDNEE